MDLKRPALLCLAPLFLAQASASLDVYTDRTAWVSAAGAPNFAEDFESFDTDTSFRDAPVALNGMSIARLGTGGFDTRNIVDVAPYIFPQPNSDHAEISLQDGTSVFAKVEIEFDQAVTAFGFRTWEASGSLAGGTTVEVYNGASLLGDFDLDDGLGSFHGFHLSAGESATHVVFRVMREGTNLFEGFGLDDLEGNAVPEPGTMAALALGLAAVGRRRRKA